VKKAAFGLRKHLETWVSLGEVFKHGVQVLLAEWAPRQQRLNHHMVSPV